MPQSRGRKRKTTVKRTIDRRPQPGRGQQLDGEMVECMQAVGAAEARGDVGAALMLIAEHPVADDGSLFWRPPRLQRLLQLAQLEGLVPRWAVSRWILDQSLTVMDRRMSVGHRAAARVAIELRGGADALPGRDELDRRVKLAEHDWVYRQLYLYEHGGLSFFLRHHAAADLVAGADRIHEWSHAPMRALRLVEREPTLVHYVDLTSGEALAVPNTGPAVLTAPGDHVLARLVPAHGGQMVDGLPLWVPRDVAEDCAGDPQDWAGALRRGLAVARGPGESMHLGCAGHNQVLTDVPELAWQLPFLSFAGRVDARRVAADSIADAAFAAVRAAMVGELERMVAQDEPGQETDPWPCLAAALVHPLLLDRVDEELAASDPDDLLALSDKLVGPASDLCRRIAQPGAGAA